MNVSDSEIIRGLLDGDGFTEVSDPGEADAVILISCAVREHAETRVLGRASHLAGLRTACPDHGPLIVLCGCVAQEHGERLLARSRELDLVVGPDCYRDLPRLIRRGGEASLTEWRISDQYEDVRPVRGNFPRSFVTIMRGCDNYCSYCIVPYVRGRERSRSADRILEEVRGLSEEGYGEITLLGQNVNSYRDGSTGFAGLLSDVSIAAGPAWVRFVTSHPKDLDSSVADVMASGGNICNQLHLPLQSGSDAVLKAMRRGYTAGEYLGKVAMLRERMPDIVLSTDIIAGFPGETEKDFEETVGILNEVRFDYAFLFRYSERQGTAAAALPGALPEGERLRRLQVLQELQGRITAERSELLVGRSFPVLVTGDARRPGQQAGRTPGNRSVVLEGTSFAPGEVIEVTVTRADGWTHFGKPADR